MKKQRRVRYSTEESILEEIDNRKAAAKECLHNAVACDESRKVNYQRIHALEQQLVGANTKTRTKLEHEIWTIQEACTSLKQRAVMLSRRRNRIENIILPKLSVALAQFRTEIMQPITQDRSVLV